MSLLNDEDAVSEVTIKSHSFQNWNNFAITNTPAGNRPENDDWVTTYMDLITLLLTLFIVLLAYSSQSEEASFSETTKVISETVQGQIKSKPNNESRVDQDAFGDLLINRLSSSKIPAEILSFKRSGDDIEIQLNSEILFESGDATLASESLIQLKALFDVLANQRYFISIEGHTDNVPINTTRYPSNWELSSARASSVARFLIEQGISDSRVRVIGYADSRPIGSNFSESGRKLNRRVTLVVSQSDHAKP